MKAKELKTRTGLTQEKIASIFGISLNGWQKLEDGTRNKGEITLQQKTDLSDSDLTSLVMLCNMSGMTASEYLKTSFELYLERNGVHKCKKCGIAIADDAFISVDADGVEFECSLCI